MARALPVLATPVANDGLAAEPGRSILIGDTPEAMAREAVRALGDPAWATRIGLAGQEHARREFGEERALACIERAFGLA
ncbi:MAG: hypothetical protein BWZ10_01433 [candidate division BRC1 bacterium ADurb.BinA364]|nr:MAG: hypothetical protein BWZ10_01433 [candidate division BRC1 bacterium ADurb.BinA364]